jgi:hypothetical protein
LAIFLGEQWRGVTPERDGFDIRRTGRDVPILASYFGSEIYPSSIEVNIHHRWKSLSKSTGKTSRPARGATSRKLRISAFLITAQLTNRCISRSVRKAANSWVTFRHNNLAAIKKTCQIRWFF